MRCMSQSTWSRTCPQQQGVWSWTCGYLGTRSWPLFTSWNLELSTWSVSSLFSTTRGVFLSALEWQHVCYSFIWHNSQNAVYKSTSRLVRVSLCSYQICLSLRDSSSSQCERRQLRYSGTHWTFHSMAGTSSSETQWVLLPNMFMELLYYRVYWIEPATTILQSIIIHIFLW